MVELLRGREQLLMRIFYAPTVTFPDGQTSALMLFKTIRDFHAPALSAIGLALESINHWLAKAQADLSDR